MTVYSQAYIDHIKSGPFRGMPDPFAEAGRYYQQIHSAMIGHIVRQIDEPLLSRGYFVGREASLQIAENRQPDVYVQLNPDRPSESMQWDYEQAATGILMEPGVTLQGIEPELDALFIKDTQSGELVTVIEIVSPRNKHDRTQIAEYQDRRLRLLGRTVNVVEVDLTRSIQHLISDPLANAYEYHFAIHLHDQRPRLIGMEALQSLKPFALPLRGEVIPVEIQPAYESAYKQVSLPLHINKETGYTETFLPFPSTLSDEQRATIMQAVDAWKQRLTELI